MSAEKIRPTDVELIWRKIERDGSCWRWVGCISDNGYGQLRRAPRAYKAHRYIYELLVEPVPAALDLDHLCRNRWCVNPAHLEPVTRRVNLRRSPLNPSRRTHCPKGHLLDGVWKRGRYCMTCNREKNRAWKERRRAAASS